MTTVRTLIVTCGIAAVLTACATTSVTTSKSVPAWVTTTPQPTATDTYFVGSGSDPNGNIANANENAVHSLVSDITRYLGVTISSQTTVETRAGLKSFQTHVAESIHESSAANVGDFSIVDRWIRHDGQQVTVFLLGRYKTSALVAEKNRLAALARERIDAVAVPEKEGDDLLSQGKPYKAAVKYMQASLAATGPDVENASIKFERNAKKATQAVASITVKADIDNLKGYVGQMLPHPFVVEVTTATKPVANAPFRVSYPILRSNGRPGTATTYLDTDAEGKLTVKLPSLQLIGNQSVTVALDLAAQLEPLFKVPTAQRSLVAALEQQINKVRIVLHYSAASLASTIPTGVLVMDLDRGGTRIPQDETATGIVNALTAAGFDILPIPSSRKTSGVNEPDLVKILRNEFGDRIKRAIIGQAKISGFEQSGETYIVKVSGTVEVAELDSGKVLLSTSQIKLSRASDATSAITAAFKDLGQSIGNEIRNRLY